MDEKIESILSENEFNETGKDGLWIRENNNRHRADFIDFRNGKISSYSYEGDESAEVPKDVKKLVRRLKVERDKIENGQQILSGVE